MFQHPAGGAKTESHTKEKGLAMDHYTIFRDEIAESDVKTLFPSVSPRNSKMGNIPSFSTMPGRGFLMLSDGRVPVRCYNRYRANREALGKKGGGTMHPLTWILAPFVFLYSVIKAIFGTMK